MSELIWQCECGGVLSIEGTDLLTRNDVVKAESSLWRYQKALPIKLNETVSRFGEGLTPLVPVKIEDRTMHIKLDSIMPSGSFKDRGASILINSLAKMGVSEIVDDSSGNAAASAATYCAAAGMRCIIFVPAHAALGKQVQIAAHGAQINKISGTRDDVTVAAIEAGKKSFYASHNWHPLFVEGVKTLAYEIWEQLGWKAPDNIVLPAGGGSSVLGVYKGFSELVEAGEIESMPRIYAVQAANCSPIHCALQGLKAGAWSATMAEGVALANPVKLQQIVAALHDSAGSSVAVPEEEIMPMLRHMALMGYYMEPTSAMTFAGVSRLTEQGHLKEHETTVVLVSGHGLKATDKIGAAIGMLHG
jgi:threonine synthase